MSKATSFLGGDPGVNGGLAIVAVTDRTAPVLVECIDIPVTGTGAKERVDAAAIRNFIDRHKPEYALVERAQAMPRQGSSTADRALTHRLQSAVVEASGIVRLHASAGGWHRDALGQARGAPHAGPRDS